jgi:hypothetical protein
MKYGESGSSDETDPKTRPRTRKRKKTRLYLHRKWKEFQLLRARTGSKQYARHWVSCRGNIG